MYIRLSVGSRKLKVQLLIGLLRLYPLGTWSPSPSPSPMDCVCISVATMGESLYKKSGWVRRHMRRIMATKIHARLLWGVASTPRVPKRQ